MREYFENPEASAEAIDADGWMHSGDLCTMDERGYCRIEGRLKDMIIRGGENIYPKEIETVAYRLPGVAEAAVVGRANALYGEEPVMFVATSPGSSIDIDQIQRHLADSLSKYKRPVDITFLDELPKNAVGKIDKPSLRRRVASSQQPTKQGK